MERRPLEPGEQLTAPLGWASLASSVKWEDAGWRRKKRGGRKAWPPHGGQEVCLAGLGEQVRPCPRAQNLGGAPKHSHQDQQCFSAIFLNECQKPMTKLNFEIDRINNDGVPSRTGPEAEGKTGNADPVFTQTT